MRFHRYGDASVIVRDRTPRPVPRDGEVLIRVAATSFNPTEVALRAGLLRGLFDVELPYALGWDVAGTVVAADGAVGVGIGDRVIGRLDTGGAAAEFVVADPRTLTPAPTAIPLPVAAAIPLAGLTAWQTVFEHAEVASGQRVFVNGAGGGIGGFAVQLARHAGAQVIATASPRSRAAVVRHGADLVIDYTTTAPRDVIADGVDVLINLLPLTPAEAADLVPLVRPGGLVVSAAAPVPADTTIRSRTMVARNDIDDLAALVRLVDAGIVTVDVSETHRHGDLAAIHRRSEAGDLRGKVILLP